MYRGFLKELFLELDNKRVDYLVLRGYELLPDSFNNDIDFSVRDEYQLMKFFKVLHGLSNTYEFIVRRDAVRFGLLKVVLQFDRDILKIDVFHSFQYAGLIYMDIEMLHKSKRRLTNGIAVPSLNFELAISIMKEILHNARIRSDKIQLLRRQYDENTFCEPFMYLSKSVISELSIVLFLDGQMLYKMLGNKARISLLALNVRRFGVIQTFLRVVVFFYTKYLNQSRYSCFINGGFLKYREE